MPTAARQEILRQATALRDKQDARLSALYQRSTIIAGATLTVAAIAAALLGALAATPEPATRAELAAAIAADRAADIRDSDWGAEAIAARADAAARAARADAETRAALSEEAAAFTAAARADFARADIRAVADNLLAAAQANAKAAADQAAAAQANADSAAETADTAANYVAAAQAIAETAAAEAAAADRRQVVTAAVFALVLVLANSAVWYLVQSMPLYWREGPRIARLAHRYTTNRFNAHDALLDALIDLFENDYQANESSMRRLGRWVGVQAVVSTLSICSFIVSVFALA